jgi:hypothetical protein
MTDPCASRKEIENADPVRQQLGNLLTIWYSTFDDLSQRTKDIIKRAEDEKDALFDILLEIAEKNGKIDPVKLGIKLRNFEKRPEKGLRLQKTGKHHNADTWRVTKI